MSPRARKRPDPEARPLHGLVARNLRRLMAEARQGQGISVLALSEETGLGTGSIQAILRDPDHSPGLRVLQGLAEHFDLPGPWSLLVDLDLERDLLYWLASHRLPFALGRRDVERLVHLAGKGGHLVVLEPLLGLLQESDYATFRQHLDELEGRGQRDAIQRPAGWIGLTSF